MARPRSRPTRPKPRKRKRAPLRAAIEAMPLGVSQLLGMVATGAPLPETLETLARVFEGQAEGMLASVLLVENDHVRHAAAPSLPAAWVRLVDGQPIGPNQGSCGTAAFLKRPVIVSDIATDPRWAGYRNAALSHGLRACWSVPIIGSDQLVLGTFALYYREPREPTPELLALAMHASHLAAVAIQHHRHQDDLRESEARARLIIESALDANVLIDTAGLVTGWNGRAEQMFGWTAAEAVGRQLSTLIIPERYRAQHEQGLERYLATGVGPILNRRVEITAQHRDGRQIPVELAITPIARGDRLMFSAFIEDISAAKEAAAALRRSQQHLSLVYDHVADVLFDLQVETGGYRFVALNPAFAAATGLDPASVLGKYVHDVIPEPSRSLVLGKYAEAIRTRATVRWEETTPYPTGTKYGDVAVTPVFDAEGTVTHLIGSVRDVTDQRRMEGEVRQLQKLEAIGRLSGGIAHDFNNILGVILGTGQILLEDLTDPDARSLVQEIVTAGKRGADLTRQFLAFSRNQVLQPKVLDLNDVVHAVEPMLRRLIPSSIAFVTAPTRELWPVLADPGQVEQVVVNLAVNARDAMPNGGKLTLTTENVTTEKGAEVLLTVVDTGHGMDEETQKRIFEPFFTTKQVGKGTGLGLATVYGIVTQSGGRIHVKSAPGRGTAFQVFLPRVSDAVAAERAEKGPRRDSGSRKLANVRVLVVEDEPAFRSTIEQLLRHLKCDVRVAATGDEALAIVTRRDFTPDLLLTDMIMPGMSGATLARRVRETCPRIKVLLMSGYADQTGRDGHSLEPDGSFLQKPFGFAELAAAIREVLDAPAGPQD